MARWVTTPMKLSPEGDIGQGSFAFLSNLCNIDAMTSPHAIPEASVLLAFRAGNARSFRDDLELSTLATAVSEDDFVRMVRWREGGKPIGVNPVLAIFGANGSGKSNVLKVMDDMRSHVLYSFRHGRPSGGVPRRRFLLDPASGEAPTRYEVDIVLKGIRWEYGFAIDDEEILEEWAYRYPHGRASLVFHRHGSDVEVGANERAKGRAITGLLRDNALYLSTAASANHRQLGELYGWFERNLQLAEADSRALRQVYTANLLEDASMECGILELLRAADLGISGAKRHELDPVLTERMQRAARIIVGEEGDADSAEHLPSFEELNVRLSHRGADGTDIELDAADESLGTRVWFGLAGPVLQALAEGSVFLADELDASLHPMLVAHLVKLFQDEETNPHRAQLIFNSHDAWLLGDGTHDRLLGRDQVWLSEKGEDGCSRVYPLVDLSPRKNEALSSRYLDGRYGGTPILSHQEFVAAAEIVTCGGER